MDFSVIDLTNEEQEFLDQVQRFIDVNVTDERLRRERESGDGFIEELHLTMAAEGWLEREVRRTGDGGFSPVERRIWDLKRRGAKIPLEAWGATMMILQAVLKYGSQELLDEVVPGVYHGEVRFALGYTEPEGGSDIATAKTKAVRDGDEWVINGQKMFTTGAHQRQYVFLLTNTDPNGRRHRNLTMFLVPLHAPGIEIQGLRTVDGARTNITYYSDVRILDRYRLGDVNDGWTVLSGPLATEHGAGAADPAGLSDISVMSGFGANMAEAADAAAAIAAIDDESVAYRLGRAHARIEAALSTPGIFGRVAISQTMRDVAPDLMDALGSAAALPTDTKGAAVDGATEYLFRYAPLNGIYGGTIDVFRNMIAQHVLGLGRPNYSPPK
jgi:alkylation response protein AidB-like acyl-CoA dehydrogenase